jgi:hypothetical protein
MDQAKPIPREAIARATRQPLSTLYSRARRWGLADAEFFLEHAVGFHVGEWSESRGLKPALCQKLAFVISERSAEEWAELFDSGKKFLTIELLSGQVFLAESSATYGTGGADTAWLRLDLEAMFDIVAKAIKIELARAISADIAATN